MYKQVDADLKQRLSEMSDEEKARLIFLSRDKGHEPQWSANVLSGSLPKRIDKTVRVYDYEKFVATCNVEGYQVYFISDPLEDFVVFELTKHSFASPSSQKDRDLLLLVGETEFETPTARWTYDVPGVWYKTDLTKKSGAPIIAFHANK